MNEQLTTDIIDRLSSYFVETTSQEQLLTYCQKQKKSIVQLISIVYESPSNTLFFKVSQNVGLISLDFFNDSFLKNKKIQINSLNLESLTFKDLNFLNNIIVTNALYFENCTFKLKIKTFIQCSTNIIVFGKCKIDFNNLILKSDKITIVECFVNLYLKGIEQSETNTLMLRRINCKKISYLPKLMNQNHFLVLNIHDCFITNISSAIINYYPQRIHVQNLQDCCFLETELELITKHNIFNFEIIVKEVFLTQIDKLNVLNRKVIMENL